MYKLSKAAKMLLKNREMKLKVAAQCEVGPWTVYNWIKNDDPNLIRLDVLDLISAESSISVEELVTKIHPEPGCIEDTVNF